MRGALLTLLVFTGGSLCGWVAKSKPGPVLPRPDLLARVERAQSAYDARPEDGDRACDLAAAILRARAGVPMSPGLPDYPQALALAQQAESDPRCYRRAHVLRCWSAERIEDEVLIR